MEMNHKEKIFDTIRFTGDKTYYYGASIDMPEILLESGKYKKHTEVHIPLGHSRYGGPVVDLPVGVAYPEGLFFAAQLDLAEFSRFDKTGLLPKSGQLILFSDIMAETGKVIYADVPNAELVRHVKEHEDHFFSGMLVDQIYADTESFSDRFRDPQYEEEKEYANEDGKIWDDFAGSDQSKLFGIYTHCQLGPEEIEAITFSDKVLLLQVGENDFNEEGVFSVLIPRKELENKNFDHCEFSWGQS